MMEDVGSNPANLIEFLKMKIEKLLEENLYTFSAMLLCEFCEHKQKLFRGFNSLYYKTTILNNIPCHKCGKETNKTMLRSR